MTRRAWRLRLGISQAVWLASSRPLPPEGHADSGPASVPRGSMSSDGSPNAAAASERRDAVREKAQQVQAQQSRARAVRITTASIAIVAVVAVAAVVVTWAVSSSASKPMLSPENLSNDGFVVTDVTG